MSVTHGVSDYRQFDCLFNTLFNNKESTMLCIAVTLRGEAGGFPANPMVSSSKGNIFRDRVQGIHLSPVNSPHKGQWRGELMFSLICAWANGWVNNRDAGGFRRHRAHYDVTVMRKYFHIMKSSWAADYGSNFCCQQRNALSELLDPLRFHWRGLLGMRCVGGYNIIDIWA